MKKLLLTYCLIFLIPLIGKAHEANTAFFEITQHNNSVVIEAQFPWSIRNALLEFEPSLEQSKNNDDFKQALFEYINTSIILIDSNEKNMELLTIEEFKNNGHSHEINYLITYKGENLKEIKNTIMFNTYKKQQNYHHIKTERGDIHFSTTTQSPLYDFFQKNKLSNWWFSILVVPMFFFLYNPFKKIIYNKKRVITEGY